MEVNRSVRSSRHLLWQTACHPREGTARVGDATPATSLVYIPLDTVVAKHSAHRRFERQCWFLVEFPGASASDEACLVQTLQTLFPS